jgi:ubiquinone/menaquinone biosynthesis C-methylase UbiE
MNHTQEPSHAHAHAATNTHGRTLHSPRAYDLLAWLLFLGREPAFRRRILDLADLAPGDAVLDVGCGTGTLAIEAKKQVGAGGDVRGVDASPEMVARARTKARRAGLSIAFEQAVAEALPFPDARFDVVLSSLLFHHLPRAVREQCARSVRRVAKPRGRIVVVDFGAPGPGSVRGHFHRHGSVGVDEIVRVLEDAGLSTVRRGPLGIKDMHFVVARAP